MACWEQNYMKRAQSLAVVNIEFEKMSGVLQNFLSHHLAQIDATTMLETNRSGIENPRDGTDEVKTDATAKDVDTKKRAKVVTDGADDEVSVAAVHRPHSSILTTSQ